jgi:beta-RFAP synthase
MIEVVTASRLHFGLINPGPPAPRRFGGAGMMIERPGLHLRASPAAEWSVSGPLASRVLEFARRFCESFGPVMPQHFEVLSAPAEHVGLGTGTQLGMAVARLLAVAAGRADLSAETLARHVGRGRRSAIGIHGFEKGGFLVDGGQGAEGGLAPLLARLLVPESWRVVLALLPPGPSWFGNREQRAFEVLVGSDNRARVDRLCRLLMLGMMPALLEADIDAFGEALFEYNALAGEAFAQLQGGVYAEKRVADTVAFLRRQGVRGVGQSSWGPTVFAIAEDENRAASVVRSLERQAGMGADELLITRPAPGSSGS